MYRKNTVLVVDDEKINQMMLRQILADDYKVLQAGDGRQALDLLQKNMEDIAAVILDLVMPKMDGYAFLTEYKNHQDYRNVPVIVATAESNAENEKRCLELGAWDFVTKPYHPGVLKARVRNTIERSRMHEAEHDPLTGLYSKVKFYQETKKMLAQDEITQYVFLKFDIDQFKIINSFYGLQEGDRLIKSIANGIDELCQDFEKCIYGRMESDVFCICKPYIAEEIELIM